MITRSNLSACRRMRIVFGPKCRPAAIGLVLGEERQGLSSQLRDLAARKFACRCLAAPIRSMLG